MARYVLRARYAGMNSRRRLTVRKPPHRLCVKCGRSVGRNWKDYVLCKTCLRKEMDGRLGDSAISDPGSIPF